MTVLDFEGIKQRVSITSVLSQYVSVPPTHRSTYRIPCPLHNGTNKNFKVDEERGLWWCHKCSIGGDSIKLLALLEGISNSEAATRLMSQHGLQAADSFAVTWRKTVRHMGWMESKTPPSALTEAQIPVTQELRGYRDFSPQAISHFGLRLIPGDGWGSGVYIPIRKAAEVVGYSIRHTHGRTPKYLNTEGLAKDTILYGLWENQEEIIDAGFVYLVEGQFDCVSAWDKGYRNVVAVMCSHLSVPQAQQLMAITSRIVLLFDGDEAGRDGMVKIKQRYNSLFSINSVYLPEGEDPATADLGALLQ